MLKNFKECLGKYIWPSIFAPLAIIVEVIMEVTIPFIMALIIDEGITKSDIGAVWGYGGLMVGMSLLSLLGGAFSARFASVAGAGLAKGIRKKLFDKIQDFSFANVDKFSTASLVTRLTTDVTNTQNSFMMVIRTCVRAPIMLICAFAMALNINLELSIIFMVAIPILAIALGIIMKLAFPRFQAMLKKYDKLNAIVQENLVGIRVVKAFVRGDYENEKFRDVAQKVMDAQVRAEKVVIFNFPIMQFIMYACMLSVSWFGGNLIIAGDMQTGELLSFISYVTQILMSLMMISMIFVMLVLSRASINRIQEVFEEELDIKDNGTVDTVKDGSIEFSDVSFSYFKDENNLALENISFKINSGETIGIIGGTGSSKTTLVQLIPRLYETTKGEVKVGDVNVNDYRLNTLRDEVAMVLQKNVLFSGTIRENLLWGDQQATQEEIEDACKQACAHDFITSFPDGYETELGQGGVNVSGGQKQRLCIARALLKKPKIIILDDSTSAVDTATDSSIRKALKENLRETTTLIIAQRITSVKDADRIIVLDEGKIDDIGTHDELLARNEIYQEVYESQQKGAE